MKTLLSYLKKYSLQAVLAPLFKFLEASFDILVPLVVANIIDDYIPAGDRSGVIRMCILLCILALIGLICSITAQYFAAWAATGFAADIRYDLFKKVNRLSYSQIDKLGTATMINRLTSDVLLIQNGINLLLRLLLRSPFIVIGALISAFLLDPKTALVLCVIVPLLTVAVWVVVKLSIPAYNTVQQETDQTLCDVRENLSGARVIRAFGAEEKEEKDFIKDNSRLTNSSIIAGKISALLNPLTYAVVNIGVIALIWIGAVRVTEGRMSTGTIIALYNYMTQILTELVKFANITISVTKAAAGGKRIKEILDLPEEKHEPTNITVSSPGDVVFKNVSISYGSGEPALSDVSFEVSKGMKVGILGGTGSGKTTLLNLIAGFYSPTSGEILCCGINPKADYSEELLSHIGIVPQKAVLFQGNIRQNLLWGNSDATDTELEKALRTAQALDIVQEKDGLQTTVLQGGKNFSGGQRQRLTIARALVREPDILLLDDSSSALDYITDAALRKSLFETKERTVFIAAQRASAVMDCDLILVLEDGKLVGKGKHKDLLKNCSVYREIYLSQFPEMEVFG